MREKAFEAIHTYGQVAMETERYSFYQLPDVKEHYDGNFMKLYVMPEIQEFEGLVDELRGLARKFGNPHGKIVFPEGVRPTIELMEVAKGLGFEWSFLELYEVEPGAFIGRKALLEELEVRWLTPELVEAYGQMHYEETVQWGEAYATAIRAYKEKLIARGDIRIIVALLNGELVGSTDVILSDRYVEIDNFFVKPSYQKRGFGAAIQQFVMDVAGKRKVILVADGEDTPREMYQSQGYELVSYQYAALNGQLGMNERSEGNA